MGSLSVSPLARIWSKALIRRLPSTTCRVNGRVLSPLAGKTTLTPLVGREQEVGLLLDRWEQVKEGRGQVVLLSGEPGIGKSRLAYTLQRARDQ